MYSFLVIILAQHMNRRRRSAVGHEALQDMVFSLLGGVVDNKELPPLPPPPPLNMAIGGAGDKYPPVP